MPAETSDGPGLMPLDREVLDSLAAKLREAGVSETVISCLTASYQADRIPSAEALLDVLKQAQAAPEARQ